MMLVITDHRSRTLNQEPDTISFIPQHSDYIVVGTYHLNKSDEPGQAHDVTTLPFRNGSLQILPFTTESEDPEAVVITITKDLPCAIVDLKFHPEDESLLGIATSTGELRFFRIHPNETSTSARIHFDILEIGIVTISAEGESGKPPLITYFCWLAGIHRLTENDSQASKTVTIAACDTTGETKLVRVKLPATDDAHDLHLASESPSAALDAEIESIHKQQHHLEAWYVTDLQLQQSNPDDPQFLILSGGDDGCLLASTCNVSVTGGLLASPPCRQFNMRKEHEAGVISILVLDDSQLDLKPILTGAYDDHLRLFLFQPSQLLRPPVLTALINLGGGVWRISLLDHYTVPTTQVKHHILLICAMYEGAKIIRLTADPEPRPQTTTHPATNLNEHQYEWKFTIEAEFKIGHESMVYAGIARQTHEKGQWTILTTSFYDRKLCEWTWLDEVRSKLL